MTNISTPKTLSILLIDHIDANPANAISIPLTVFNKLTTLLCIIIYTTWGLANRPIYRRLKSHLLQPILSAAIILALGIGIQNFPEGTAVSVPLRREGFSRGKAFFYGQLSGIVEPISGVIGAVLVLKVRYILPFLLAFAGGAMIYVVVQELIPASQSNEKKEFMALSTLIGFVLMMVLDVALG